jgi:hypothetical protein
MNDRPLLRPTPWRVADALLGAAWRVRSVDARAGDRDASDRWAEAMQPRPGRGIEWRAA